MASFAQVFQLSLSPSVLIGRG